MKCGEVEMEMKLVHFAFRWKRHGQQLGPLIIYWYRSQNPPPLSAICLPFI